VEVVQEQQEEEQQPEDLQPAELEQQPMVVLEELEDMEDAKPTSIRKEFSHEPYFNFDFNWNVVKQFFVIVTIWS